MSLVVFVGRAVLDDLYLGWAILFWEYFGWRHPLEFGLSRTVKGGGPLGHGVSLYWGEWALQAGNYLGGSCWLRVVRGVLVGSGVGCWRLRVRRCFVSIRWEFEPILHYLVFLLLKPFLDNLLVRWAGVINLWGSSLSDDTTYSFFDPALVDSWVVILLSIYHNNIHWGYSLLGGALECILKEFLFVGDFKLSLFCFEFADYIFHILFNLGLFFDFHFFLCVIGESLFLSLLLTYQNFEVVKLRRD